MLSMSSKFLILGFILRAKSIKAWDWYPAGARPFKRADYIKKFDSLTDGIIEKAERNRFIDLVQNLSDLTPEQVQQLNVQVTIDRLLNNKRDSKGIF